MWVGWALELQLALRVVSRVASSFTSGVTHGAFRCVASVGEPACATLCNRRSAAAAGVCREDFTALEYGSLAEPCRRIV